MLYYTDFGGVLPNKLDNEVEEHRRRDVFCVVKTLLLFSLQREYVFMPKTHPSELIKSDWQHLDWNTEKIKVLIFKFPFVNDEFSLL